MNKPALDMSSVFGKALPLGGLYCGVVLQQRLDLMEHLLEFGRQLILLSGDKGAGKTTLLQTISEKTSDRWQCIFLEAGPQLGAEALLSRVADELDIGKRGHDEIRLDDDDADETEPPSGSELLAAVRQRITELDRSGMMVVLILDDADQLLIETVGVLLQLARTEEPLAEARVLMAALPEHSALLGALQQDHGQHGLVHVVEIPLLAEDQVEPFLTHRFTAVGERLEDWLDEDEVRALGAESAGNPGNLVNLAREALAGREPRASSTRPRAGGSAEAGEGIGGQLARLRGLGPMKWAPLLALPLAAAAWFMFKSPSQDSPQAPALPAAPAVEEPAPASAPPQPAVAETKTVQLEGDRQRIEISLPPEGGANGPALGATPELPPPTPAAAPAPAQAMSTTPEAEEEDAVPVVSAEAPAAPAAPVASTRAPAATPPAPAKPAPKDVVAKAKPVVAKPAPSAKPVAKPQPAARPAPAPKPAPSPKVAGSGYALQLFGVSTRSAATNFIARHGLGASARTIDTQRNGKPWFIVTYGNYPSRTAAQNAAARLPPAVQREVDPWVRDVKTLNSLPR